MASGSLSGRRVTRRSLLRGAGVGAVGLMGAALVGCSDSEDTGTPSGATATAAPDRGPLRIHLSTDGMARIPMSDGHISFSKDDWDEYKFDEGEPVRGGIVGDIISTDPSHFSPFHSGGFVPTRFYDSPYTQHYRGPFPVFTQAVKAIEQSDELTYVLTLDDSTFQDVEPANGRKVTAEDLFASAELRRDDKAATGGAFWRNRVDWANSGVVDEVTLRIVTDRPINNFVTETGVPFAPKEAVDLHLSGEKQMQDWDHPVGSGWLRLEELRPGSHVLGLTHPGWSRSNISYVDGVRWHFVTDPAAQEAMFRAGDVYWLRGPDKQFYERFLDEMDQDKPTAYLVQNTGSNPRSWMFVNAQREPWNDIRVRQAFVRALDRDLIMGQFDPDGSLGQPGPTAAYGLDLPADDPLVQDWMTYDPADAQKLLAAARSSGADVDRAMRYVLPSSGRPDLVSVHGDTVGIVRPMLQEAGFNLDIQAVPDEQFSEQAFAAPGNFDIGSYWWTAGGTRLDQQVRIHHSESGLTNQNVSLKNPEIDSLIEDWEVTQDMDQLVDKTHAFKRKLMEEWSPVFPLYNDLWRRLNKITYRNVNGFYSLDIQEQQWIDESYWPR